MGIRTRSHPNVHALTVLDMLKVLGLQEGCCQLIPRLVTGPITLSRNFIYLLVPALSYLYYGTLNFILFDLNSNAIETA